MTRNDDARAPMNWVQLSGALATLALATLILPACAPRAAAPPSPYAALAALPDWSGTWANEPESSNAGFKDCCAGDGSHIPFTPKFAEWRRAVGRGEDVNPGGSNRNNSATCIPAGMPAVLAHPILFEFLFTPGRVTMIFNDNEIRKIDTSTTVHPPRDEIETSFLGHSIGRWEGQTLVVDTIGMDRRADIFMSNHMKAGAALRIVERMTLEAPERLRIDTTLTDPEMFTQPFSYTRYYQRVPGDFVPGCAANNVSDGFSVGDPEVLR
jgi:hypothetical protein